jgi:hypothetical protein
MGAGIECSQQQSTRRSTHGAKGCTSLRPRFFSPLTLRTIRRQPSMGPRARLQQQRSTFLSSHKSRNHLHCNNIPMPFSYGSKLIIELEVNSKNLKMPAPRAFCISQDNSFIMNILQQVFYFEYVPGSPVNLTAPKTIT